MEEYMAILETRYDGLIYAEQNDCLLMISDVGLTNISPLYRYKNEHLRYPSVKKWLKNTYITREVIEWIDTNTLGNWNIHLISINKLPNSFMFTFSDENERMLFDLRFS